MLQRPALSRLLGGLALLFIASVMMGCGDASSHDGTGDASVGTSTESDAHSGGDGDSSESSEEPNEETSSSAEILDTAEPTVGSTSTLDSTDGSDESTSESTSSSMDSSESESTTSSPPADSEPSSTHFAEPAEPCSEDSICPDDHVCLFLDASHELGSCAPTCEVLGESCGFFGPGTWAECSLTLEDGSFACGFICVLNHGDHVHNYSCPSDDEWGRLRCERNARDGGHRYCAPRQP